MSKSTAKIEAFIERWRASGAGERANFQPFAIELCELLGVESPQPTVPDNFENAYVFERAIPLPYGTTGYIDLYKRGCFVLEAKQGSEPVPSSFSVAAFAERQRRKRGMAIRGTTSWDTAMERAKQQAQSYARCLPANEISQGRPPFLIVLDIGNSIALYAEFTRTGGHYTPFPDPNRYRFELEALRDQNVRQLLRQVWEEPLTLDPARRSAQVTREIASHLAILAKSLEERYSAEEVSSFLMRSLFTMFAEDVGLLPPHSFMQLLLDIRHDVDSFQPMLEHLWQTMNTGGFSVILRTKIPFFNGGLFANSSALPLRAEELELLIEAAKADWREVEPAIFGTLLERALEPIERHKLGAHYTPRAYVERLILPTVIEPLRAEWQGAQTAALLLVEEGQVEAAITEIEHFQKRLATIRILDPACGSGNFLYITLEQLKRLEGEVLEVRQQLGAGQALLEMEEVMVTPQQFLGLEVNPRAAAIADLVLWIGYLQWHYRTRGQTQPPTPIIKSYQNIKCCDAVLDWDEKVPDESARIPLYDYINPRPATWPKADFIVGNPPFIGDKEMREVLGGGYVDSLRKAYQNIVPNSADYVMYWWDKAAELVRKGESHQFGFITTNSLRQKFNRRILQKHLEDKEPLSIIFAIPDHPWVDTADGADVRIAMTTSARGHQMGLLQTVISEAASDGLEHSVTLQAKEGQINADLTIGANVAAAKALRYSNGLHSNGVMLSGSGFIVTPEEAQKLGLGQRNGLEKHIRPYRNGRDLAQIPRDVMVIDLYGLTAREVQLQFPEVYQWIYQRVKPAREQNRRKSTRENWWLFGEVRKKIRPALEGLLRYIATPETAKHRFFVFLDASILPDHMLIAIASDDAYHLGVLSSRLHITWALAAGGILGPTPRYNKTRCFEPFPFPDASDAQKEQIRQIAEALDAHRKRQQAQHAKLTMTDIYNVLQKLRSGEPLSKNEQQLHQEGLLSILKALHDELDAAVFDAYGWSSTLSDDELLENLVTLNAERAAEEADGLIRWLRPDYQNPSAAPTISQATLIEKQTAPDKVPLQKFSWPQTITEQAQAIHHALNLWGSPATAEEITALFGKRTKKRTARVRDLLQTLTLLGQARQLDDGRFVRG